MIVISKEEIPVFAFNTKTNEFAVLGHKFEGVNSIEEFIQYITNLDKRVKKLEQINQEHQKLNGELREKINKLKENK